MKIKHKSEIWRCNDVGSWFNYSKEIWYEVNNVILLINSAVIHGLDLNFFAQTF